MAILIRYVQSRRRLQSFNVTYGQSSSSENENKPVDVSRRASQSASNNRNGGIYDRWLMTRFTIAFLVTGYVDYLPGITALVRLTFIQYLPSHNSVVSGNCSSKHHKGYQNERSRLLRRTSHYYFFVGYTRRQPVPLNVYCFWNNQAFSQVFARTLVSTTSAAYSDIRWNEFHPAAKRYRFGFKS